MHEFQEKELALYLSSALTGYTHLGDEQHCWVSVEIPRMAAEGLLCSDEDLDAVYWSHGPNYEFVALGVAARITGRGEGRFRQADTAIQELWRSVLVLNETGPLPMLVGGFAFQPSANHDSPWVGFGDIQFFLPRYLYTRRGSSSWLSMTVTRAELGSHAGRTKVGQHAAKLLARSVEPSSEPGAGEPLELRGESREHWRRRVELALRAVSDGAFVKVVLARSVQVRFAEPLSVHHILTRLITAAPAAHCFAVRIGAHTFVGAPPERLFTRQGSRIETEAIAGSAPLGDVDSATHLLGSEKILAEQRPVVDMVVRNLAPLVELNRVPEKPEVHEARGILHLKTAITGRLYRPQRALHLAEVLHPTPAVGGFPTPSALAWLKHHERLERGWYSGCVGWLNRDDDAEFQVALRSGVIAGNEAHLFAGAGIVANSNPDDEFLETAMKLDVLRRAL